ncbi:MAG: PspC domain-containing protein [Cryomorphaceae bacterium]|nr:PspC domain-containing protein [Cryomorphaceae bacterium]
MNKTLSVNIGGYVFNIEEDAYQALQNYLDAIARNFKKQSGADEIMADIEARIAELFNEALVGGRQVVIIKDVEWVIERMGRPEQVAGEDDEDAQNNEHFNEPKDRRLYRDPENAMLGGVCSGLGYYLGWEPSVVRIIFFLLAFFGFAGIPIYIILWIAMPEAKTTAEKLRMKGQKINVENISKSINDEFENVKSSFSKMDKEGSIKNGLDKLLSALGLVVSVLVKVIKTIVGAVLILTGVAILITAVALFVGIGKFNNDVVNYDFLNNFIFFSENNLNLAYVSAFLLLVVPVIALFYMGMRAVMSTPLRVRGLGLTLLVLLILASVMASFVAIYQVSEYSDYEMVTNETPLNVNSDTLVLAMLDDPHWHNQINANRNYKFDMLRINDDFILKGDPKIRLEVSKSSEYILEVIKKSHGKTTTDALHFAEEIEYNYITSGDTLFLSPLMKFPKGQKFREQETEVVLHIPEGRFVDISKSLTRMTWTGRTFDNLKRSEIPSHTVTVENAALRCADCPEIEISESDTIVSVDSDIQITFNSND